MAKIKIVYGTGGGNTEMVCHKVADLLALSHQVDILPAKSANPADLGEYDLLILASPTYGHGVLEQYFEVFLRGLENVDLKGKNCAIIGLGDPKYDRDYHLESIKIISDFLKRKEANIVGMPLRVSKNPLTLMKILIEPWAEKLAGMV